MSKKKGKGKTQEKKQYVLGRPKNTLKIGIVGYPNVGKSTIFNAMTNCDVPAENYSFCTRGENKGICVVPDPRLDALAAVFKPPKVINSVLNVVDIAGLVKGASNGDGLGNEFLSYVKQCDALYHLVRVFTKKNISHHEGSVDPIRDIENINEELRLKDIQVLEKLVESLIRPAKGSKQKAAELKCAQKALDKLKEKVDARYVEWDVKEVEIVNSFDLLTAKPQLYLVNVSPKSYRSGKSKAFKEVVEHVKKISHGMERCIAFSAIFEYQISRMPEEKRKAFCDENKCWSAVDKIIKEGYELLNLHHFFSHNEKELKSWTIPKGTPAVKAAGRIHGDFERTFICAEVYKFEDFEKYPNEGELRGKGLIKVQGKTYIIEDGDIVFFKCGCMGH